MSHSVDRPPRLVVAVGVAILGLAIALAIVIEYVARTQSGGQPRLDEVPRAISIPSLYATAGLLAIVGARQRRPAIILATGVLCLMGAFISFVTVPFLVPGLLLIALASRVAGSGTGFRSDAIVATGVAVLVAGAVVSLLGTTEGRCWEARGSPTNPTYTIIPCSDEPVTVGDGDTFASGYDGGVLTTRGAVLEGVLLLSAITLAAGTGRRCTPGHPKRDDVTRADVPF